MSLSSDITAIENGAKAFEHRAVTFLVGLGADVDKVAPEVQTIMGLIPAAAPALAVFDAAKAALDALDSFLSQSGNAAPAALVTAYENLKASIAKATGSGSQTAAKS